MKRLSIGLFFLLLGCADPAPIDIQTSCPPLKTWSKADQAALADALAVIPHDSMIWTMELDWQATRDAIRACQGINPIH